jgi:hypothetical protein
VGVQLKEARSGAPALVVMTVCLYTLALSLNAIATALAFAFEKRSRKVPGVDSDNIFSASLLDAKP